MNDLFGVTNNYEGTTVPDPRPFQVDAHERLRQGLRDGAGITATLKDIVDNPKKLRFRELEAATLPRVLNQVDLALINTNYALEAGLNPRQDALVIEGSESPYVNILVARPDNSDTEAMRKLAAALRSDAVREFINARYQGAVVPAF